MTCIELFDHFDARAAILGDLVYVGAFHEPEANISMAKGIRRSGIAVAVLLKALLLQDVIEDRSVVAGK